MMFVLREFDDCGIEIVHGLSVLPLQAHLHLFSCHTKALSAYKTGDYPKPSPRVFDS